MELQRSGNKYEMTLTEPTEVDAVANSIINLPKKVATMPALNQERAELVERALGHGANNREEPMRLNTDETSLALHALEVAKSRIESPASKGKNPYAKKLEPTIISLADSFSAGATTRQYGPSK